MVIQTGIRLKDKVAIVTGGASGIGRAYALGLAGEGARVVVADIDEEAATALANQIRQRSDAMAVKTDVSSWQSVERMASLTVEHLGRIDVLVNNAAVFIKVPLSSGTPWEITEQEWDRVMAVNVKGPFLCIKAVVPYMKSQGKGKIINISSAAFFSGAGRHPHYVASKGGVIGLSRSMARILGEFNINVNCIAPGSTLTENRQDDASSNLQARAAVQRSIKRGEVSDDLVGTVIPGI